MEYNRLAFVIICGFVLTFSIKFINAQNQDVRIVSLRDQRRVPGPQSGFRQSTGPVRTSIIQGQSQRITGQGRPTFNQPLPSNRRAVRRPLINFMSSNNPTLVSSRAVLRVGSQPGNRQSMRSRPQINQGTRPAMTPLGNNRVSVCRPNESLRCQALPPNVSPRNGQRCNGNCPGRTCIVNCICRCSRAGDGNNRIIPNGRLQVSQRRRGLSNGRRMGRGGAGFNRRRGGARGVGLPGSRSTGNGNALNFGITDSVLANLLSQPDLVDLVGPQGINDILAGVPPSLLPTINEPTVNVRQSSGNTRQQDLLAIAAGDAARQRQMARAGRRGQADGGVIDLSQNMGIPIPLSLQSLAPPPSPINPISNADVITSMIALSDSSPFETIRDLVMPSATIDTSVRVRPNNPNNPIDNQRTGSGTTLQNGGVMGNIQNGELLRPSAFDLGITTPRRADEAAGNQRRLTTANEALMTRSPSLAQDPINRPEVTGGLSPVGTPTIQNFVQGGMQGAVQAIERQAVAPTSDECLAARRELWCNSIGVWDGTPGLDRWCLLNCRSNNCDTSRCSCSCVEEGMFRMRNAHLSRSALI